MNQRSLEILHHIVETYVETGEPIGSLALSQRLGMSMSSATIRNVMARLEELGLLYSPHTSAGRLPTEAGLRFFVQGLLESGVLASKECNVIQENCLKKGLRFSEIVEQATSILAGLSSCASFLIAPKQEVVLRHIEFVTLEPGKALAILVTNDGEVENRLITLPPGITQSALTQASNYLNYHLSGKTLTESKQQLAQELNDQQKQLDELTKKIIEQGIAVWSGKEKSTALVVQGQRQLLENISQLADLEAIKKIFHLLERQENLMHLLDASLKGDGVQIFIGAQNEWFSYVGCSLVLSPYENREGKVVGAVGVIGPTRINYGRIIPMVDYTAKIMTQILK